MPESMSTESAAFSWETRGMPLTLWILACLSSQELPQDVPDIIDTAMKSQELDSRISKRMRPVKERVVQQWMRQTIIYLTRNNDISNIGGKGKKAKLHITKFGVEKLAKSREKAQRIREEEAPVVNAISHRDLGPIKSIKDWIEAIIQALREESDVIPRGEIESFWLDADAALARIEEVKDLPPSMTLEELNDCFFYGGGTSDWFVADPSDERQPRLFQRAIAIMEKREVISIIDGVIQLNTNAEELLEEQDDALDNDLTQEDIALIRKLFLKK